MAADGLDHTGALEPEPVRQRTAVQARAVVDIDVVEPDRVLPDTHFIRTGVSDVDFGVFEYVGSAMGADDDGLRFHELSLLAIRALADASDGRDNT